MSTSTFYFKVRKNDGGGMREVYYKLEHEESRVISFAMAEEMSEADIKERDIERFSDIKLLNVRGGTHYYHHILTFI